MAVTTYNAFVSALIDYNENQDSAFLAMIPTFLFNAQKEIERDLDNLGFDYHAYTTVVAGDPYITKPDPMYVVKDLIATVSGGYVPLRMKELSFLRLYWPDRTSVGTPKYFANWDQDTLIIAPPPSQDIELEMTYSTPVSILSSAAQENYLTKYCSNALLYKAMALSCLYQKDSAKHAIWEAKYQEERDRLRNEARRDRRDNLAAPGAAAGPNTQDGTP